MDIIPNEIPNLHAVYKRDIINILLLFCLIMPDDFFGAITLYTNKTPDGIAYKWLDYQFGIASVVFLVLGFWH